jgi:hypothetical protein
MISVVVCPFILVLTDEGGTGTVLTTLWDWLFAPNQVL